MGALEVELEEQMGKRLPALPMTKTLAQMIWKLMAVLSPTLDVRKEIPPRKTRAITLRIWPVQEFQSKMT